MQAADRIRLKPRFVQHLGNELDPSALGHPKPEVEVLREPELRPVLARVEVDVAPKHRRSMMRETADRVHAVMQETPPDFVAVR